MRNSKRDERNGLEEGEKRVEEGKMERNREEERERRMMERNRRKEEKEKGDREVCVCVCVCVNHGFYFVLDRKRR